LKIEDFDYDLPNEAIARYPLAERDASRLLALDRLTGRRQHCTFSDLPQLLQPGDLLVVNRSRVLPARLIGQRSGGGSAELLLVRRESKNEWLAMARPGRRLRLGSRISFGSGLSATLLTADAEGPSALRRVRLEADEGLALDEALRRFGRIPLPPYLGRDDEPEDRIRYQTIYAREAGSIAAPTAGLHFTDRLLSALAAGGIDITEILLHVGPGTFRPVEAEDVRNHEVDPELFEIPDEAASRIAQARRDGRRIVAVGTTVVRTLESAPPRDGGPAPGRGETRLVIVPGHTFQFVDALITNFHLPRSSLLLLVSAFAGREPTLEAYAEAVRTGYRFYSYGDAMLIG
jgi:S-adenosylmethionine:tRNA ribosyltransferase-isomerase